MSTKSSKKSRSSKKGHNNLKPRSKSHGHMCSSTEFELDRLSRSSSICNEQRLNDINGAYEMLKNIDEMHLKSILWDKNNPILYDSLLKVYSAECGSYIHVSAVLTKEYLYFTSARNYQIWMEFRDRTKIDDILTDEVKIDDEIAKQLTKNMDITNDKTIISVQIAKFLLNKTKNYIKLNILTSKDKNISLPSIFAETKNDYNCNEDDVLSIAKTSKMKNINCVVIENIDVINQEYMDEFMRYIFDDIEWNDDEMRYNSKLVTLYKYHTNSIIRSLNRKKDIYFTKHNISNSETVIISPYDDKINTVHNFKCKIVDLKKFNKVNSMDLRDIPYCFKLKDWFSGSDNGLICQLSANNQRQEWITHLDYVMNGNHTKATKSIANNKKVTFIDLPPTTTIKKSQSNEKLMNDFTNKDDIKSDGEFLSNFNFGIYLNYWELGYDNSVKAIYPDLKTELLNNKYFKITREQYYSLYRECLTYSTREYRANDIGINNKKFNIPKGTPITINHFIALKVYTDYSHLQRKFKTHCRKYNNKESMKDFISRNSEIANWCRYLKECCTFYGQTMSKKMVVFTGLKNKLMFDSMMQQFECPLSTTIDPNIANVFADTNGVILMLKRANPKTRYFDVSKLSEFPNEQERLFMGSSLKIVDILINCKASDNFISAIHMFEQIIDGQFIDGSSNTEDKLLFLIQSALKTIKKGQTAPPNYFMALFMNLIKKMQEQNITNELWINIHQLDKIKNQKLKKSLNGFGKFFNHFGVNITNINSVREYRWTIDKEQYNKLKNSKPRQYIESPQCQYNINNEDKIQFHLECYGKYSEESQKCALFLLLDGLPDKIEEIRIAFDVQCNKKPKFRQLMAAQWLSRKTHYCGFQTFAYSNLLKNNSISWVIGLKIMDILYKGMVSNTEQRIRNQKKFDMKRITEALENNDTTAVIEFCKELYAQNKKLMSENQQKQKQLQKKQQIIDKKHQITIKKDLEIKQLRQRLLKLSTKSVSETSSVTTPTTLMSPSTVITPSSPMTPPTLSPPTLNDSESFVVVDATLTPSKMNVSPLANVISEYVDPNYYQLTIISSNSSNMESTPSVHSYQSKEYQDNKSSEAAGNRLNNTLLDSQKKIKKKRKKKRKKSSKSNGHKKGSKSNMVDYHIDDHEY